VAVILSFLHRLFCRHTYGLVRWHWTHWRNGNEPSRIEAEYRCSKCGKLMYVYPERGSELEEFFVLKRYNWNRW